MKSATYSRSLSGRTVLISPADSRGELATQLQNHGARVLAWPTIDVGELEDYTLLDEGIENLFGYDWLIFQSSFAVDFFVRRFLASGHAISELDSLRVCGVGEDTARNLEQFQIHIDVMPDQLSSRAVFDALGNYLGGAEAMRRLNFLVPGAGHSRDCLPEALADTGARADMLAAYRTCSADDSQVSRINALLAGGGIDCLALTNESDPREFATICDTNDLDRLLKGVVVAWIDPVTTQIAQAFGLNAEIVPKTADARHLAQAIAAFFSVE